MKIAVFGSWKSAAGQFKYRDSEQNFRNACVSLGRKIAQHGHKVIVASDALNSADRWIVEGIIQEIQGKHLSSPLIEVAETETSLFFREDFSKKYPELFRFNQKRQSYLESICLGSIKDADVILTVCGGQNTLSAGLIAIAANKWLVPIGSFGGASEKLSNIMESGSTDEEIKNMIKTLRGDWTSHVLGTTIKLAHISAFPRMLIAHGQSKDWGGLEGIYPTFLKAVRANCNGASIRRW